MSYQPFPSHMRGFHHSRKPKFNKSQMYVVTAYPRYLCGIIRGSDIDNYVEKVKRDNIAQFEHPVRYGVHFFWHGFQLWHEYKVEYPKDHYDETFYEEPNPKYWSERYKHWCLNNSHITFSPTKQLKG